MTKRGMRLWGRGGAVGAAGCASRPRSPPSPGLPGHAVTPLRRGPSIAHRRRLSGTHRITSSTLRRGSLVYKCNVNLFTGYFVLNRGRKKLKF